MAAAVQQALQGLRTDMDVAGADLTACGAKLVDLKVGCLLLPRRLISRFSLNECSA